jgi:GNAT superfamily N-acetyltransferase
MTPAPLTEADRAEVLHFLAAREAQSMFLIANLLGQGLPMETWVWRDAGRVVGVLGRTEGGMILPQWPGNDWRPVAGLLADRPVEGILGAADQVATLRKALGLSETPTRHDGVEPGYRLDLAALRMPESAGYFLRPITNPALVVSWRASYEVELFGIPPDEARDKAVATVARWQAADSHRLLWHRGQPVAVTGFNARLPDVGQVGGVYVPPILRGKGFARRAVGLHLAEARAHGLCRAVLFAASAAAAKVYEGLGFQPAGAMGLVLFAPGQRVSPPNTIEMPCP